MRVEKAQEHRRRGSPAARNDDLPDELRWYVCGQCGASWLPSVGSDPENQQCGLCFGKHAPAARQPHARPAVSPATRRTA